jgi:hypothetical protein
MAAPQAFNISRAAQEGIIQFHRTAPTLIEKQWNIRESMRQIDIAYIREADYTKEQEKARLANLFGDADKIQNITIPIIKPQVRAAVAYQAAVFLTDYPILGVVSAPQYISAAKQMQAVIEENSIRGSWVREFLLYFQDGFKYNLSAIEVCWDKVTTAAIETDPSFDLGQSGKVKEIIWSGNKVTRWDPYNTYFDCRVEPYDLPSKGEFVGRTQLMSRTALKSFIASLDNKIIENIQPAFESPSSLNPSSNTAQYGASYYLPLINGKALIDPSLVMFADWEAWVGLSTSAKHAGRINYRGIYEVSTEYVRIIPSDYNMKVPAPNTPQVWKFIIVNHSVIIYAERQTNAHEKIPVFFGCPAEDGLVYQTKSLAQDAVPFQQVSTALMNSVLASRRRAVTDRVLYDPSRISEGHMNNPNPSAKIPVRPSAYGKPVGESVYQFPFRDDQAGISLQEIQSLVQFSNVLNGQNQARQGQFVKGNKTDGQWESTMSNATSQDQITALLYEAQVFTPLKEVIKLNILQYQGAASIYSPSQETVIDVDPVQLRQAILNFKITDGLLPADKVIKTDTMQTALQAIASSATLAQGYNIAPMFSYLLKTQNVDFMPFEKSPAQLAYEQALGAWQQVAMQAAMKGVELSTPMPTPQEFGYDPNMNSPEAKARAAMSASDPAGSSGGMSNGAN